MSLRIAPAVLAVGCLLFSATAFAGPGPIERPVDVHAALAALKVDHPALKTVHRAGSPVPSVITGLKVPTTGETPELRVQRFVDRHGALLGGAELTVDRVRERPGRTLVHLKQHHAGQPILDRAVAVTLDDEGNVIRVNGAVRPLTRLDAATIDADAARAIALQHVGVPLTIATIVRSGIAAVGGHGTAVYEVELSRRPLAEHLIIRVDAHAGTVLSVRDAVH